MKRFIQTVALIAVLLLPIACTSSARLEGNPSSGVLIVFYDPATGSGPLLRAARHYGSDIVYQYEMFHAVALTVPRHKPLSKAIRYYRRVKGVIAVNKDERMELQQRDKDSVMMK